MGICGQSASSGRVLALDMAGVLVSEEAVVSFAENSAGALLAGCITLSRFCQDLPFMEALGLMGADILMDCTMGQGSDSTVAATVESVEVRVLAL